jgi:type VI protein secretion system component Hcp
MIRRLSCLLAVASMAAACGTADPEAAGSPASDPTVNALEASGQVEFFVTVVGADGQVFSGESSNALFQDSIPAIRYFSDVNKAAANARTRCTVFRFTKVVGAASPQLVDALASGEVLDSVHFDFVRSNGSVFQEVDLTGIRISKVEQAVAPPDDQLPSVVLEEATLVPALTATVTLTANPLNADGSAAASIVSTFTCRS